MSIINLNDLLPPPPPGSVNVKWQWQLYPDGTSRYVSAYVTPDEVVSRFADQIFPDGAMDGANQTYTLPDAPNPPECLRLVYNGNEMLRGRDYTLDVTIITLIRAFPNSSKNEWLAAWYRY